MHVHRMAPAHRAIGNLCTDEALRRTIPKSNAGFLSMLTSDFRCPRHMSIATAHSATWVSCSLNGTRECLQCLAPQNTVSAHIFLLYYINK